MKIKSMAVVSALSCVGLTISAFANNAPVTPVVPNHVLVGYWQAWGKGSTGDKTLSLKDLENVPYNVIDVAFGNIDASTGTVNLQNDDLLTKDPAAAADEIHQLEAVQHKIVMLSLGGQNGTFSITSPAQVSQFVSSLEKIVTEYGFQGVDFDIENGLAPAAGGTVDNPGGSIAAMISAIKQIHKDHPQWLITYAPQTADLAYNIPFGPGWDKYIPIINQANSAGAVSWVQMQQYNTGSMPGIDGQQHKEGSVDFVENITPVLMSNWGEYTGLQPNQVVIGLPATSTGAAPSGGYLAPSGIKTAFTQLDQKYPGLRGVMTWSINWDAGQSTPYAFGDQVSQFLLNS